MFRKLVAIVLAALLWMPVSGLALELPDAPSETKRLEKLKKNADALRLSTKQAIVVLNDDTKITGQITALSNDGFALSTSRGEQRQFSFTQVRTVKKSGLSTGAKVLIGIGVGVAGSIIASYAVAKGLGVD